MYNVGILPGRRVDCLCMENYGGCAMKVRAAWEKKYRNLLLFYYYSYVARTYLYDSYI